MPTAPSDFTFPQDINNDINRDTKMTPRAIKIAIRDGRATTSTKYPQPPKNLSPFQRARLRKAYRVVYLYLHEGVTVPELAQKLRCKHQNVCQILDVGIRHLLESGHISITSQISDAA